MPAVSPTLDMQTRDMTSRELTVRSQSINEDQRSFEAVASTETPALVFDWRAGEVVEEILVAKGGLFPASVPLLDDHSRYNGVSSVLGSAANFRMVGDEWLCLGTVGQAVEGNIHREQTWRDVADGHIRAVSIGYQVLNYVDIPAGQKQMVDGKQYEAGQRKLRVTNAWRVFELSLTPVGADSEALIRSQTNKPTTPLGRSYFAR